MEDKVKIYCPIESCMKKFRGTEFVYTHLQNKHSDGAARIMRCKHCLEYFDNIDNFLHHYKDKHSDIVKPISGKGNEHSLNDYNNDTDYSSSIVDHHGSNKNENQPTQYDNGEEDSLPSPCRTSFNGGTERSQPPINVEPVQFLKKLLKIPQISKVLQKDHPLALRRSQEIVEIFEKEGLLE